MFVELKIEHERDFWVDFKKLYSIMERIIRYEKDCVDYDKLNCIVEEFLLLLGLGDEEETVTRVNRADEVEDEFWWI